MSMTTDCDRFFESDHSYAERQRKIAKKSVLSQKTSSTTKASASNELFSSPETKIMATLVLPAENILAVGTAAGFIFIVSLSDYKVISKKKIHSAPLTCITSDGTTFFTGSWDKNIKAVKFAGEDGLETWADGIKLEAHADFVKTLATLSPLQLLISGGADKLIRIWNYNSNSALTILKKHTRPIEKILILPSSSSTTNEEKFNFLSAGSDMKIYHWQGSLTETGLSVNCLCSLAQHETSVYALTLFHYETFIKEKNGQEEICKNETLIVSGSADKSVHISDLASGETVLKLQGFGDWVKACCILELGMEIKYLIVGLANEQIYVFLLDSLFESSAAKNPSTLSCSSWEELVSRSTLKPLVIEDAQSHALLSIDHHADSISDLIPLPHLEGFLSSSLDGFVMFWNASDNFKVLLEEKKNQPETDTKNNNEKPMMTAEEEAELSELLEME